MKGFINIHAHVLYGVDDGPSDRTGMFDLLRAAYADGISAMIATPHASPGLAPFPLEKIRARLDEAAVFCAQNGLDMRLFDGAEVLYSPVMTNRILDGRIPTLANTRYVLIEFYPNDRYEVIEKGLGDLRDGGYLPILAHVERYHCLVNNVTRALRLKCKCDVLYQMNCATAATAADFWINRGVKRLIRERLVDIVSSDAHRIAPQRLSMTKAYGIIERMTDQGYADALFSGNAMSIIEEIG